ncbi:MipA/OmpV family protein [Pseudocolwellia sp. AS88]|uniref:MipA/OmpV family protein n=1 Tax=Pseudocolwellia sp. AS88 TaxID=3063958 RepID=UPI0026F1A245|nr:MipA/OmpV family protein [Pseudocolwellia sp. AS88]MDO7083543.1 MipA/OmpV family protein [Pseudocolwellia sp. AS88]
MHLKGYSSIALSLLLLCSTNSSANTDTENGIDVKKMSVERTLTGFEDVDEALSLWELGVGGGAIEVANYPASSQRNSVVAAAPYVVYRGDIFRVGDGNGVRAVVVDKNNLEIGMSFGGAFAADSENGTAREGMPELDFLLEIGPQAIYKLKDYKFENGGNARLNARLQFRSAFSTDFSTIDNRGYVLNPVITYQQRGRLFEGTALSTSIGMLFATERFHDYFYQVSDEFVTDTRPAYDAKGGYLGTRLALSVSFPMSDSLRGFVGVGAQIHSGSANEDSPLYEKDITYSASIGFVWRLYKSERKAGW